MRRLLFLISALMFLELFFFAVLAPLLPGLKQELRLSTTQTGVLVAMYAFGALAGGIPATMIAVRAGVKATALASLVTFAAMSVAFGLARGYDALLAARFAQGLAGAACWTAAMVWLLEVAPVQRRGAMLGFAFGVSEAGAIAGPVVGGLAAAVGRSSTFVGIAVFSLLLAMLTLRFPPPPPIASKQLRLRSMLSSAHVRTAMWIAILPAILLAAISVLAPLQQHRLGAGAGEIAATFGVAATAGILIRPLFGRWSDRHGPLRPIRLGLLASAPIVLAVPWIESRWAAALLVIARARADRRAVGAPDGDALRRMHGGRHRPGHGGRDHGPHVAAGQRPRLDRRSGDRAGRRAALGLCGDRRGPAGRVPRHSHAAASRLPA